MRLFPRCLIGSAVAVALLATPSASMAAAPGGSWVILGALSGSAAGDNKDADPRRVGGWLWGGTVIPLGVIVSTAILAFVLVRKEARENKREHNGPRPVSPS